MADCYFKLCDVYVTQWRAVELYSIKSVCYRSDYVQSESFVVLLLHSRCLQIGTYDTLQQLWKLQWRSYWVDSYHPICLHRALDASPTDVANAVFIQNVHR